jgi:hypothetical protein
VEGATRSNRLQFWTDRSDSNGVNVTSWTVRQAASLDEQERTPPVVARGRTKQHEATRWSI